LRLLPPKEINGKFVVKQYEYKLIFWSDGMRISFFEVEDWRKNILRKD